MATALGVVGYWTSSGTGAGEYLRSPEPAAMLRLDVARGDKCLGFFILGHTDKTHSQFRSSRGPISAKTTWNCVR